MPISSKISLKEVTVFQFDLKEKRVCVCVGDSRGLSTRNAVLYSPKGGGQGKSPVHKVSCSL